MTTQKGECSAREDQRPPSRFLVVQNNQAPEVCCCRCEGGWGRQHEQYTAWSRCRSISYKRACKILNPCTHRMSRCVPAAAVPWLCSCVVIVHLASLLSDLHHVYVLKCLARTHVGTIFSVQIGLQFHALQSSDLPVGMWVILTADSVVFTCESLIGAIHATY